MPARPGGACLPPAGRAGDREGWEGGQVKILHRGDPCPCCGQPIQTEDPERLLFLSWLAEYSAIRDAIQAGKEGDHAQ